MRQSGPEILINRFFQIDAAPADTEPVLHRTQSDGMPVTNGKLAAVRCGPAEKFPAAAVAQHQALYVLRLHTGKKMRRNPQLACHTDQHDQQKSNGVAPHHHKSRFNCLLPKNSAYLMSRPFSLKYLIAPGWKGMVTPSAACSREISAPLLCALATSGRLSYRVLVRV